ncbi:class F sortase [Streptomyces sp. NBC_00435]|uniref:class F sortase n=1 Tax=Streptomyces sp. NBC_00435 TaxID=2903649 RepID=UPI002E1A5CC5
MHGRLSPGDTKTLGRLALCVLAGLWMLSHPAPPAPAPPAPVAGYASGTASAPDAAPALPASRPARVAIPTLDIDAPVTAVGLDDEGWMRAPDSSDPGLAGWFTGSVTPGERGTSVIDGHVDTTRGPAVFHRLGAVETGARVTVTREDASTARFTVYRVESVPRETFPADRVYGDTGQPELRLITCGGTYSKSHGYTDNVIVYAYLDR